MNQENSSGDERPSGESSADLTIWPELDALRERMDATIIEGSPVLGKATSTAQQPTTTKSSQQDTTPRSDLTVETVDAATKEPAGMLKDWGVSPPRRCRCTWYGGEQDMRRSWCRECREARKALRATTLEEKIGFIRELDDRGAQIQTALHEFTDLSFPMRAGSPDQFLTRRDMYMRLRHLADTAQLLCIALHSEDSDAVGAALRLLKLAVKDTGREIE